MWGGFKKRIHTSMAFLVLVGVTHLVIGFTPAWLFWLAAGHDGPIADRLGVQVWWQIRGVTLLMALGSFLVPAIMKIEEDITSAIAGAFHPPFTLT